MLLLLVVDSGSGRVGGEAQQSLGKETSAGSAWESVRRVGGHVGGGRLLAVEWFVADEADVGAVGQLEHPLLVLVELGDVAPHVLHGGDGVPLAAHQTLVGLLAPGAHVGPRELVDDLLDLDLAPHVVDQLPTACLLLGGDGCDLLGCGGGGGCGLVVVVGVFPTHLPEASL